MSDMQKNILGRVRQRVESVGLQYVQDERWGNMGTIRAMRDLEVVLRLDYAFYDSYGDLTFSGPAMERQAARLDVRTVYGVREPNPRPADVPRDRAWQSGLRYDDVRSLERPMALLADLLPELPAESGGPMTDTDVSPRRAQAPADPNDVEALLAANWDGDGPGQWRDDDSPHDNTRRAGFAGQALLAYADVTRRGPRSGAEPTQVIGDFLCDLRHLCDALDLDFDALSEKGREHYDTELRGE